MAGRECFLQYQMLEAAVSPLNVERGSGEVEVQDRGSTVA